MLLYHGSNVLVDEPKIIATKKGLDFGAGFYLTSSYEQAKRWAELKKGRSNKGVATVSVFEIDDDRLSNLKIMTYPKPDRSWLEMITANRIKHPYDIDFDVITGPVADDETNRTISFYFQGMYTAEETLKRLLPERLKDQYTFKTEESLTHLKFVRGENV